MSSNQTSQLEPTPVESQTLRDFLFQQSVLPSALTSDNHQRRMASPGTPQDMQHLNRETFAGPSGSPLGLNNQSSLPAASHPNRDRPAEDPASGSGCDPLSLSSSKAYRTPDSHVMDLDLEERSTPTFDKTHTDGYQTIGTAPSRQPRCHADMQKDIHAIRTDNSPLSPNSHQRSDISLDDAGHNNSRGPRAKEDRSRSIHSGSLTDVEGAAHGKQTTATESQSQQAMTVSHGRDNALYESDSSLTPEPDDIRLDEELNAVWDPVWKRTPKSDAGSVANADEVRDEDVAADGTREGHAVGGRLNRQGTVESYMDCTSDESEGETESDVEVPQMEKRHRTKRARKSYIDLTSEEVEERGDDDDEFMMPPNDSEDSEAGALPGTLQPELLSTLPQLSVDQRAIIGFPDLATRGHLSPSGNLEGLRYIDIFALLSNPLDYKGDTQRYANYSQYASTKSILPQGLHPRFIVQEYPNHLQGDVISWIGDLPWREEYQSRDMLKLLPEDARPVFRGQEQPHSYIQKRQTGSRFRILGRAYVAGILDPNYRVPPRGQLFRDYGKNGQEGQKYIEKGRRWLDKPGRKERIAAIRNTPQNEIYRWFVQPDLKSLPDRPATTSASKPRPLGQARPSRNRSQRSQIPIQIQPKPAVSAFHVDMNPSGFSGRAAEGATLRPTTRVTRSDLPGSSNMSSNPTTLASPTIQSLQPSQSSSQIPLPRPRASNRDRQTKPLGRQPPSATASAFTPTPVFARQSSLSTHQNVDFVFHRCRLRLTQVNDDDPETLQRTAYLEKRRPTPEEISQTSPGQLQALAKEEMTRLIEVTKLGIVRHRQQSGSAVPDEDDLTRLGRHQVAVRIDSWLTRYHARGSFWLGGANAAAQETIEQYIPVALNEQLGLLEYMVKAELDIPADADLNEVRTMEIERLAVVRQLTMLRRWTEEVVQEVAPLLH